MTSRVVLTGAVVALATAQATLESQSRAGVTQRQSQVTITVQPFGQQDEKNPYNNLVFSPPRLDSSIVVTSTQASPIAPPTPAQWKVECGIKVIVVNPDIDPKMIVTPLPGAAEPKIQRIAPPPCRERDARK